jgi:predicted component of type VI protein secretion system
MEVKLVVVGGDLAGKAIPIGVREFVIGRGEECQLRPHSTAVSRKHCAIVVEKGVVAIEDFGSTNGTFVNGERIQQRRELNNGERIRIHRWEFEVQWAVSPKGKTKPKVHSVQEAAARTVAAGAMGEEDWDIRSLFQEDEAQESVTAPVKKPATDEDTAVGKGLTDTAPVPAPPPQTGAKAKEKTPAKAAAQPRNTTKPSTGSASSAVSEVLRKFFSTKR